MIIIWKHLESLCNSLLGPFTMPPLLLEPIP
jgi:hypothetical protein